MTNMFKKTLVATALTAFASSSYAVVVSTSQTDSVPHVASTEFVASKVAESSAANRIVTLPNNSVVITAGVGYVAGDIIELTFSGATLATGLTPTLAPSAGAIAYQGVSATNPNTLVFAVTTDFAANTTMNLSGVSFQASTVGAPISLSYRATNSSGSVVKDNFGTTSRTILNTRGQYAASVSEKITAKVNPADRKRFSADATTATFKVKAANRATITPASSGVWVDDLTLDTATRLNITIGGEFSAFTASNGDRVNVLSCSDLGSTDKTNATPAGSVGTTFVQRYTNNAGAGTGVNAPNLDSEFTCTFDVSSVVSNIPLSAFTAGIQFATSTGSLFSTTNNDLGSFAIDGATINVPYMPFGDNITQVINVTNSGSVDGAVTVEARDRTGNKYGPVSVGTATAGTQVALAGEIKDALIAAGMPANERAELTIVVAAPSAGVSLYTAYNVNGTGARLVVNSSNGK